MITQALVQKLFRYDDGDLIRRVSTAQHVKVGDCAGSLHDNGYLMTGVNGRLYLNHRLIWLHHHGYLPENGLDHIDQNKLNNRLSNLREVSQSCNSRNTKLSVANNSGVKGVCWYKANGKWGAQIMTNKKACYLGYHDNFTEAVAHRLAAEQCLNWSNCDSSSPAWKFMAEHVKPPSHDSFDKVLDLFEPPQKAQQQERIIAHPLEVSEDMEIILSQRSNECCDCRWHPDVCKYCVCSLF